MFGHKFYIVYGIICIVVSTVMMLIAPSNNIDLIALVVYGITVAASLYLIIKNSIGLYNEKVQTM